MEQTNKPHLILSVVPETSWSTKELPQGIIRFISVPENEVWEIKSDDLLELFIIGNNTYIRLDSDHDLVLTITDILDLEYQIRMEWPNREDLWWYDAG